MSTKIIPPTLRNFQQVLEREIYAAWDSGAINVMPVAPTGSGKTVVLSKLLRDEPGSSIAIAHRQELVSQISLALARNGVRHRIVGRKNSNLVRVITALQVAELGYSFLDPSAKCGVGGVDTVVKMTTEPWFKSVRLAVQDEGHHVLKDNKWGRASVLFPNARGLFPTATPLRADGKGLGRNADGLTDALVLAPSMRELIGMGFLTEYRIFAPPSDFHRENIRVSDSTGELVKEDATKEVKRACITGDVVQHYLRIAGGKLGVTFAVDVEEATKTAAAFKAAGVTAEVVTAETPDALRANILRRFKNREILQLVNVDLFGEGFDLPALEVVSFARPTESFALYAQQFGRVLRPSEGKSEGIVIDHVGNVLRHGLPDRPRIWSLDRRDKRAAKNDAIPLKVCVECLSPYEAVKKRCPYCDHYMPPAQRSAPQFVDGDLTELDPEVLAALRGEIERRDGDYQANTFLPIPAQLRNRKIWGERQEGQRALRDAIAKWAGLDAHRGYGESESYRRFYFRFGVDVANAQLLNAQESAELAQKIDRELVTSGATFAEIMIDAQI
jgi:DNA repair protein RadD